MSRKRPEKYREKARPLQLADSPATEPQLEKLIEAISRSQENYRELIDHLDLAIFTLSLEGEVRVANRRMAQILGVGFQELIGRHISDFIEMPDVGDGKLAIGELSKKEGWTGTRQFVLKRTEETRHFNCCLQGVSEQGELISVVGWARDVTSGHESGVRFTELLDSLRGAIFFTTVDGRILDANLAMVRMMGYESKEELQAVNFSDMYADRSERERVVAEFQETGSLNGRKLLLRRKDGEPLLCLASGISICDSSGTHPLLAGDAGGHHRATRD